MSTAISALNDDTVGLLRPSTRTGECDWAGRAARIHACLAHDITDPDSFTAEDAALAAHLHERCDRTVCATVITVAVALARAATAPVNPQHRAQDSTRQWLAWRAGIEVQVTGFLAEHMPAGVDGWSREGLTYAEGLALLSFPTPRSLRIPARRPLADQLAMYLGEVLSKRLRGHWVNQATTAASPDDLIPAIAYPYTESVTEVRDWLTIAVEDRDGGYWATLWDELHTCLRAWRRAGSPARDDWESAGWIPPVGYETGSRR